MTVAVLVTYNPDIIQLTKTLYSLEKQCDKIVIVQNDDSDLEIENEKVDIISLKKNYGIAYAQNKGIMSALNNNADFILFSDQDTIFPENYINMCLRSYDENKVDNKIGAIVPLFFNENKNQLSQIMITKNKAITPKIGNIYFLAHAISSGSFVPVDSIKKIGMMNERMFIDYVDNEWCWRANKLGYKIICDTRICINHNMGDNFKKVFGKKFVVYSNFRNYFFFRNSYYLLFHSGLFDKKEFFRFLIYTNLKAVIYFITCGLKIENIKLYSRAKFKGMFNKFSLEEEIL